MKAILCDECGKSVDELNVKKIVGYSEEHGPVMYKILTVNDVKVSMAFKDKADLCEKCIKKNLAAAARDVWDAYKRKGGPKS